ncbi:YhdB family protein [Virgibacillus siamensis]|uniref:YhdB family protein n=1 Tax=Virgibacillus siamensis TaxID=480071 RepID=A0ABP3QUW1_9BACI
MDIPDYDKALFYTLWGQWDDLLVLMVRTEDDMLSKKIQHFLHAFHYSPDQAKIMESHDSLLYYIDHAMKHIPAAVMEV